MLKQNPKFGLCLKLWTALQSNYFWTLNEKNWHTYQLQNANQYIDSDKQLLPSFSRFLWCLPDPFSENMKNNAKNWNIMLPFSSYGVRAATYLSIAIYDWAVRLCNDCIKMHLKNEEYQPLLKLFFNDLL